MAKILTLFIAILFHASGAPGQERVESPRVRAKKVVPRTTGQMEKCPPKVVRNPFSMCVNKYGNVKTYYHPSVINARKRIKEWRESRKKSEDAPLKEGECLIARGSGGVIGRIIRRGQSYRHIPGEEVIGFVNKDGTPCKLGKRRNMTKKARTPARPVYKWKDEKGQWHFSNTPPSVSPRPGATK